MCDGRDKKRGGLAGAGLGPADGITALERKAEDLCLDGRAIRKAEVVDGVHQLGGKLEIVKSGLAFGWFDGEVFRLPGWRGWSGRLACPFAAWLAARLWGLILLRFGLFGVRRTANALVC